MKKALCSPDKTTCYFWKPQQSKIKIFNKYPFKQSFKSVAEQVLDKIENGEIDLEDRRCGITVGSQRKAFQLQKNVI